MVAWRSDDERTTAMADATFFLILAAGLAFLAFPGRAGRK